MTDRPTIIEHTNSVDATVVNTNKHIKKRKFDDTNVRYWSQMLGMSFFRTHKPFVINSFSGSSARQTRPLAEIQNVSYVGSNGPYRQPRR